MASDLISQAVAAHAQQLRDLDRLRAFAQAVLSYRGINDDLLLYEAVKHGLLDTSHCSTKLLTGDDDG